MTDHASLAEALAAFQAALPAVKKSATGQVAGNRSYKYADLADITAAVLPALAGHGLSWMAFPAYTPSGHFVLRYELLHTSGESRSGEYPLPDGDPQKIGSALTYGRRYTLCSATGVVADEDDDGQAAAGSTPARRQPAKTTKPAVDEARDALLTLCQRNGWDTKRVAAVFAQQNGEQMAETKDADKVQTFTQALVSDPEHILAEPAAS